MITETRQMKHTHCLDWLAECCGLSARHNMIFYFMGDFGRASWWTGAMMLARLAPRLRQLDTAVVLVGEVGDGDRARMGMASRLAEKLELPFPLIADCQRILWRRYAPAALAPAEKRAGLVLVDGSGRPVDCWPLQAREQSLDPYALLATLEASPAE